jgi:hypothetical protein
MTSTYEDLKKDFDHLRSSHAAMVKEKANLEKREHEKEQRFQNSLRKELAELWWFAEASVATLRGDVWNSPPTPPSLTFWSGSRWTL